MRSLECYWRLTKVARVTTVQPYEKQHQSFYFLSSPSVEQPSLLCSHEGENQLSTEARKLPLIWPRDFEDMNLARSVVLEIPGFVCMR